MKTTPKVLSDLLKWSPNLKHTVQEVTLATPGNVAGAVAMVQQLAQMAAADSGTFDLEFTLSSEIGGLTFEVEEIPYDATAEEIETAIDAAAVAAAAEQGLTYKPGSIEVAGGPIAADDLTFTFSGSRLIGKTHGTTVGTSAILDDGAEPVAMGAITTETAAAPAQTQILADPLGLPMLNGEFLVAAAVNTTTQLLFEQGPLVLVGGESRKVKVLQHRPANINQNALPTHDYGGTEINQTDFRARLADIGFSLTEEPLKRTVQQT